MIGRLLVTLIVSSFCVSCRPTGDQRKPDHLLFELMKDSSDIIKSIEGEWTQLNDAEFRLMHDQNTSPIHQQLTGAILLAFIKTRNPDVKLVSLRHFLVGETDQPLLYQLMERHFVRVTQRNDGFMSSHMVEIFTVTVAYCLNGAVSGARSCLRDFQTAMKDSIHFQFGQETKFILSDERVNDTLGIADRVKSWIRLVFKGGRDSIMGIRLSRAYTKYYIQDMLNDKVTFDHPVAVYLHIPN